METNKKQKLVFGGFYRHYKHDPQKGFDNALYQVLNTAHSKDFPENNLVIYRPLQKSEVYRMGMRWDYKVLSDWNSSAEKNGQPVIRYQLLTKKYEQWICKYLISELYGQGDNAYFGTHAEWIDQKAAEKNPPIVSTVGAKILVSLVAEYGRTGVGEQELICAIHALDSIIPIQNTRFEIGPLELINTMVKDFATRNLVQKFKKSKKAEPFYRAK